MHKLSFISFYSLINNRQLIVDGTGKMWRHKAGQEECRLELFGARVWKEKLLEESGSMCLHPRDRQEEEEGKEWIPGKGVRVKDRLFLASSN